MYNFHAVVLLQTRSRLWMGKLKFIDADGLHEGYTNRAMHLLCKKTFAYVTVIGLEYYTSVRT